MGQGVWLDSEKLDPNDEVREVLKHGTLSMGFIGLAETLKALTGQHHGESARGAEPGPGDHRPHARAHWTTPARSTGMNYTLLATPAEGLSGRFVRMDRETLRLDPRRHRPRILHQLLPRAGVLPHQRVRQDPASRRPITRSPTRATSPMWSWTATPCKNLEAFEKVVRCMKDSGIGYGSINHPGGPRPGVRLQRHHRRRLPQAAAAPRRDGMPFERIRRITGYLVGTLDRFNDAKRAEEADRVKHQM